MKTLYVLGCFILIFICGCEDPNTSNQETDAIQKNRKLTVIELQPGIGGSPNGLVVDSFGNVYYPTMNNNCTIFKLEPDGTQTAFATGLCGGHRLAIDKNDNLYIGQPGVIKKISPAGVVSTAATISGQGQPFGLTLDIIGNIYYTEKVTSPISQVKEPTNLIHKITPSGVTSVFAGSGVAGNADGNSTSASFNNPTRLAADSLGNIYVIDYGNFSLRKINSSGDVTTLTTGLALREQLGEVAVDYSDNVFVAQFNFDWGFISKLEDGHLKTYCGVDVLGVYMQAGNCKNTNIWANGGMVGAPDGSLFYMEGDWMVKVAK